MARGYVYLYHLDNEWYGYERQGVLIHPQHYCGSTSDFVARDAAHRNGTGATFTKEFNKVRSIVMRPSWIYECIDMIDARRLERALKNSKNLSRYCTKCTGHEKAWRNLLRLAGKLGIDIPF